MHLKTALFGLNFDAFEYSWDETGGATRIGLALLHYKTRACYRMWWMPPWMPVVYEKLHLQEFWTDRPTDGKEHAQCKLPWSASGIKNLQVT